jgi:hypothetical protein
MPFAEALQLPQKGMSDPGAPLYQTLVLDDRDDLLGDRAAQRVVLMGLRMVKPAFL